MKHSWSYIWKISLALGVAGIILGTIGFSLGGLAKPIVWNASGAHVLETKDLTVNESSLKPFSNIEVDSKTLNVVVRTCDNYGISIPGSKTPYAVSWSNDSGTLRLTQSSKDSGIIMNFGSYKITTTVCVPNSVVLESISLTTVTGDIKVSVPSGKTRLTSTAGNISATAPSPAIQAKTTAGDINITGTSNNINATTTAGNIQINQPVPWSAASYKASTTTGDIVTKGAGSKRVEQDDQGSQITGSAEQKELLNLNVSTTVGDIHITLGG